MLKIAEHIKSIRKCIVFVNYQKKNEKAELKMVENVVWQRYMELNL